MGLSAVLYWPFTIGLAMQAGVGNGRYIRVRWNLAPETISLVILGIIWVYARKGSHLPSLKNRIFLECLTVTFAAMLSNILSTFMLCGYIPVPVWVTWAITTIYFILTPLMGLVYYLYAVSVLYEERPQLYRMILFTSITNMGNISFFQPLYQSFLAHVCLLYVRKKMRLVHDYSISYVAIITNRN